MMPPLQEELADFDGTSPIFPLPGMVLFPEVLLPLHIFEPRYRHMTRDLLAGERYLTMAMLDPTATTTTGLATEPGLTEVTSPPPIFQTVCLGRVIAHEQLPDGRYYLVVRGLSRAVVQSELETGLPYRVGELNLLGDVTPEPPTLDRDLRHGELLQAFRSLELPEEPQPIIEKAVEGTLSLGSLCDVMAYALRHDPEWTQSVLEEFNVDRRSDLLYQVLKRIAMTFPPRFSSN